MSPSQVLLTYECLMAFLFAAIFVWIAVVLAPVRIVAGQATPSAALHTLTVQKGPYRWWGICIGRLFFGIMRSNEP